MDTILRPAEPEDIPFIYATMLKSLRHDSLYALIKRSVFFEEYRNVLDCLLLKDSIVITALLEDPAVILGYLIYRRPNVVHYAFTKDAWRKMGIQNAMLTYARLNKPYIATHYTKRTSWAFKDMFVYNPFLLYKRGTDYEQTAS